MDRRYHELPFETSCVKNKLINWQKKITLKKRWCRINTLFVKISNFLRFFFQLRRWSEKHSFKTLFVEIGWEFSEIYDFWYILWSSCTEMFFFFQNKTEIFYSTLKFLTDLWSVHQDLSSELWITYVRSIAPSPPNPDHILNSIPRHGTLALIRCSLSRTKKLADFQYMKKTGARLSELGMSLAWV